MKHNLAEVEKFNKDTIVEELKKVIYPQVGEDIVTLKMVKYAGFEEGVAVIDLEIPKFDKYRENIAEEIREHLEQYKEIKEVKITM
ncbi:MAG: iron-sulfur cluster assembly protein [Candidatus Cloacimonadales bacterium]|nr:iron-sulfur cluster assembly protein [Candidatus Cloacimonadales bacterium]